MSTNNGNVKTSGQVWVLGNSKGGCRKTTTAFHIAIALAYRGNRVAFIDADSKQQSANDLLAKRAAYVEKTGEDVPFIKSELKDVDQPLTADIRALKQDYDYVIVVTAGHKNRAFASAVRLSNKIIMPFQPSYLDIKELYPTLQAISRIENDWRDQLEDENFAFHTVLVRVAYEQRQDRNNREAKELLDHFKVLQKASLAKACIPTTNDWAGLQRYGLSLIDVKHKDRGYFEMLVDELLGNRSHAINREDLGTFPVE